MSVFTVESTSFGKLVTHSNIQVFFGNKFFDLERHTQHFPNHEKRVLNQVHGTSVVPANRQPSRADGHYAEDNSLALYIKTADCLPIFLSDGNTIVALHAGWRGVLANILKNGLQLFSNPQSIFVFVGPHIQKNSFEIEASWGKKFLEAYPWLTHEKNFSQPELSPSTPDSQKIKLNLKLIIKKQLLDYGLRADNLYVCSEDTFTHPDFHSFRVHREKSGRNWSHICLL